mmetsp:Transcript_66628/g.189136  ORF Transcript_66628/g.189136 Transcript_66628/m.189136 type:complete len:203 (-) Transcript_66628:607-1215(-)
MQRPSCQVRVSPPQVISQPSGTSRPRWHVRRMLVGPQCGRRWVPGSSREKRDSPSCVAAHSATSGKLRSRRAVSGQRLQCSAHLAASPSSTISDHSPADTRSESCTEFSLPRSPDPTLPQVLSDWTAASSVLMVSKFCSNSLASAKLPASYQGFEVTHLSVRKWSGRCQQLTQCPPWSTSRCAIAWHLSKSLRHVAALSNST